MLDHIPQEEIDHVTALIETHGCEAAFNLGCITGLAWGVHHISLPHKFLDCIAAAEDREEAFVLYRAFIRSLNMEPAL